MTGVGLLVSKKDFVESYDFIIYNLIFGKIFKVFGLAAIFCSTGSGRS